MRTRSVLTAALVVLVGVGLVPLVGMGQGDTKGMITLQSKSVALGIGVNWGDGVLEYRGNKYPFTVSGLSVLDLGVTKVTARGEVRDLKKLEDFAGNFVGVGAAGAVGGGAGTAALQNQNGVTMTLTATTQGVKFAIPAGGVDVKLKQQ
jgi:hypothetical protein